MVLAERGITSRIVTDLTESQRLGSHIRQGVAGAAAGTLRQYLQQWTFWAEWAQECGLHPGQPSLAAMAEYLHEVVSGAWQDRSRVRTGSVAGVIQSWTFVGREAQSGSLLAVLDTPLTAGYLGGVTAPRPRREALPVPSAALVQWERWICSGSAPEHEVLFIGGILLLPWAGLRFADAQRTYPASLPDRHVLRGEYCKSPDLAIHSVNLVYFSALRRWCSRMGGHDLVIGYLVPHAVCYEQHPVAVATSGTAMMLFLASLAGTAPEQARQYTLHSLKATRPPCAKQLDVPELDRAEQDRHRQHGWRASVRLYSRDDVWGALACQWPVVHKVADGFRQLPLAEPPVELDLVAIPMEVVPDDDSTPIISARAAMLT